MATQVTLFPFAGLPVQAGGEPTNNDNNGAGPVRVAIQDPGVAFGNYPGPISAFKFGPPQGD
jgi:hypothetical protein